MHKEVLTKKQIELLPLLKLFSQDFGLVGGTAMALYLGHRRSIDFDLFTNKEFKNETLLSKISKSFKIEMIVVNNPGELTTILKGVRFTFFHHRHKIDFPKRFEKIVKLPDLLTLAAMKAFTLGMRAKWKDDVDLYFILKNHYTLQQIIKRAQKIFGNEFNEKLFRSQLAYFKDIDYQEKIIYLKGYEVNDKTIKEELINFSLS